MKPGSRAPEIRADEVAAFVHATPLALNDVGEPECPLAFVRLDDGVPSAADVAVATATWQVLIGLAPSGVPDPTVSLAEALTCTLGPTGRVASEVDDLARSAAAITSNVTRNPRAAVTLVGVLRLTAALPVSIGLVIESLAYSMLLAGPEFGTWRAARPVRQVPASTGPPVCVQRDDSALHVTLDRPRRRNAFSRELRDGLIDALDLAISDDTITRVQLAGAGPSFCSGGDLDEFGATPDVTTAHLVRLERSVAARLHRIRNRVHVELHGACIGAGIEIPAFAANVQARADTFVQLPEIGMGLIPGAGGTVGITRRIGRWRTAYLALSGARVGVDTALSWGLIDGRI